MDQVLTQVIKIVVDQVEVLVVVDHQALMVLLAINLHKIQVMQVLYLNMVLVVVLLPLLLSS